MMSALLHVGEGLVYSLDPLIAIGAAFWFVAITAFVWSRRGAPASRVVTGRTMNHRGRPQ